MTNPKICHSKSLTHLMFCTSLYFLRNVDDLPRSFHIEPYGGRTPETPGEPSSFPPWFSSGWCFGTWLDYDWSWPYFFGGDNPSHWLSYFKRGWVKTTNQDHIFPEIHRGRHFSALNLPGFWRTWNTSSGNMGSTQPSSERRRKTDRYLIDIHIRTCSFELM